MKYRAPCGAKKKIHSVDAQHQNPCHGKNGKNVFLVITLGWIKIERSNSLLCATFFYGVNIIINYGHFGLIYGHMQTRKLTLRGNGWFQKAVESIGFHKSGHTC